MFESPPSRMTAVNSCQSGIIVRMLWTLMTSLCTYREAEKCFEMWTELAEKMDDDVDNDE